MTHPIWTQILEEAEQAAAKEPALRGLLSTLVLSQPDLESAVVERLAGKLGGHGLPTDHLRDLLLDAYRADAAIGHQLRADLEAYVARDPATDTLLQPLLFYKGFHAISAYRAAHRLWQDGRQLTAQLIQSIVSEAFAVDIHPAAEIGCGILLDHATSFVVGETAIVEDHISILHEVTLGGTGKEHGDRHPIIKRCVLLGAGAKILGRVTVGEGAMVGAGSVVLNDVAPHTTVAGVPAVKVGKTRKESPADCMDQQL